MLKGSGKSVAKRLVERSEFIPIAGCQIWLGACNKDTGYGVIGVFGKLQSTHRAAWEDAYGPIPKGLCVLHRCDVRCCINRNHLFLGTHLDNRNDCVSKGRDIRGEDHKHALLTADQVRAIRDDPRSSRLTAIDYGVDPATIRRIRRREDWRHI